MKLCYRSHVSDSERINSVSIRLTRSSFFYLRIAEYYRNDVRIYRYILYSATVFEVNFTVT
jgi:hypothetical protein